MEENICISFHYPTKVENMTSLIHQQENGIVLSGTFSTLYNARTILLKKNLPTVLKSLNNPDSKTNPISFNKIVSIANEFGIELKVDENIKVLGVYDSVYSAFNQICLVLDEQAGWRVGSFNVDIRYILGLGGVEQLNIKNIMKETSTQIYLPNPFKSKNYEPVYITGTAIGVNEVILIIILMIKAIMKFSTLLNTKHSTFIIKNATCLPRKLDWLNTTQKPILNSIMIENGVYIQIPSLGTNSNLVNFIGCEENRIDRAMRTFFSITNEFYVSCIQLVHKLQIPPELICKVASESMAEIVVQKNLIEMYGIADHLKKAYSLITKIDIVKVGLSWFIKKNAMKDTKFQLESGLEHKEFIMGKKQGKVSKIMNQTKSKIVLHDMDYTLLIDIYNPSPELGMQGVIMLEDELPSELSFRVPEHYHKSIIGAGGKNIQRIMKQHGVYVKFLNQQEFDRIGGYTKLTDNVIARTPAKNRQGLFDLRDEVMTMISSKDRVDNQKIQLIHIDRTLVVWVYAFSYKRIKEIESECNIKISLPNSHQGLSGLIATGEMDGIEQARSMLQELIPSTQIILFKNKPDTQEITTSLTFQALEASLLQDYKVYFNYSFIDSTQTSLSFISFTAQSISIAIQIVLSRLNGPTIGSNPFNSKLFVNENNMWSSQKLFTQSVPDLRHVFDSANPSIKSRPSSSMDLFDESPNRDVMGLLRETLAATQLTDDWDIKSPNSKYCGLSLSYSDPSLTEK